MGMQKVVVVDGNNLIVRIDRGIAGRSVTNVVPVQISGSLYLEFFFSDGTTQTVGPVGTVQYVGVSPIVVSGPSISLSTVPISDGGTGATTAAGALTNLGAVAQTTTISAGTGLSGGGDLSANRTISLANTTVSAGSYGAANQTLSGTVNAQGQLTALSAQNIAIANTQVSGLGTMSTQNANAVAITGGTISGVGFTLDSLDNTPVGATTPSTGKFTTLEATSTVKLDNYTGYVYSNGATGISASTTVPTTALSGTVTNAQLAHSTIGLNGVTLTLGDTSDTITAVNPNALTIGTGLTGGSYDGSAAKTITIDSTVATLTGTQTLTNKTLTTPAISQIVNTGTLTLPTSTDTLVGRATTDTLTNKSLSGSTNTFTNIPNSGLTNSSITINGNSVALGGSTTVTASTTGTLTLGTGLTGTSFNGSTNVTTAIDPTVVTTLTGTQTLTNKSMSGSSNTFTNIPNSALTNSTISGVALGSNLNALTIGTGLTGGSYNGSSAATVALGTSGVTSGTYGSSAVIPVITVDTYGRVTNVSTQATNAPAYQGVWNASTNTPTITSSVGTPGYYYVVSVAGNTTINGTSGWQVGDWIIFENSVWSKIPGSTSESFTNLTTTNLAVTGLTGYMYANGSGNVTASSTVPTTALSGTVTNAQLANSSITINGNSVSLGGSTTVTASTTSPLTFNNSGTGAASGSTFNGGSAVTVSYNSVGASPLAGSSSLTTLGTVTTGTWNATPIANAYLANSSISGVSLGSNLNALTIGSGLTGTSYNGSSAVTIANTGVLSLSGGTTGLTPNTATSGAVTLGGTLGTANGGTGLTSFTANGVLYASGTGTLATGSALTFDGTTLTVVGRLYNGSASTFGASSWAMSLGNGGVSANYFKADSTYWQNAAGTQTMQLSSGTLTLANDASISGLTVGKGAGSVSTNTAVGASALAATASGIRNTGLGYVALTALTSGAENTGLGAYALTANTTGGYNVALGSQTLISNTTGANNTAVGWNALGLNTTASNNTALGYQALYTNTTASYNTAVGYQAGYGTTTGASNTSLGYQAGYNIGAGTQNTYLGAASASNASSGGSYNTGVGYATLNNVSSGQYNVALGNQSLYSNTTASNNTAVGYQAGYSNTTGVDITAIGYQALYSNTTSNFSMGIGYQAGYSSTGAGNLFVGVQAGQNVTSGAYNTFIGGYGGPGGAGYLVTTGSNNTIIGGYSGNQGGLDIRTASNYIVLSDGAGNPRGIFDSSGNLLVGKTATGYATAGVEARAIGKVFATVSGGDCLELNRLTSTGTIVTFDSANTTVGTISVTGSTTAYNTSSDYRLKNNQAALTGSGAFIDALQPKTWIWASDGSKGVGFIAHEVQAVSPTTVVGEKDAVDAEGKPVYQAMEYGSAEFIANIIAELQSLRKRLAAAGIA